MFERFWLHCAAVQLSRQEVAESVSLIPTKALHANENHFFWRQLLTAYVAKYQKSNKSTDWTVEFIQL